MRAAFRVAYSILDKAGFFINAYFGLGHKLNQVTFRSVWYEAKGALPRPLVNQFVNRANWALRGLFWLSKDLFEESFQRVSEPDAHALSDIRNHLEHKYLQLHENWMGRAYLTADTEEEQLGFHISRDEFAAKTLCILKLARAALIYLSLAVHREERMRQQGKDGLVMSMSLDTLDDAWKQ
jgi:hypothetical protein